MRGLSAPDKKFFDDPPSTNLPNGQLGEPMEAVLPHSIQGPALWLQLQRSGGVFITL
jgi:hypothetical protein